MKVFTHYPALAPAIQKAGYEPCLLEPLDLPSGKVEMLRRGDVLVLTPGDSMARPLMFQKAPDIFGWELVR